MGIKPRGLGDRLISLQLQPGLADVGERCPFDSLPFPLVTGKGAGFVVLADVRLDIFRVRIGLLLFDLARSSSELKSSSSSSSLIEGEINPLFLADLVTGPKYPSCEDSRLSDGVGEGEMTLGVAGTFAELRDIVKGGSIGNLIIPREICDRSRNRERKNVEVEWRCLSFREARIVAKECVGAGRLAIDSSEA